MANLHPIMTMMSRGLTIDSVSKDPNELSKRLTAMLQQVCLHLTKDSGALVQGLPFTVCGVADLLALFRCCSCKYRFCTDVHKPHLMPEYTDDVQKYDVSTYLRRTDAHRCRVNSSIFVPLYDNELRQRPIGVFEACKANSADFLGMFTVLVRALQDLGLFTVDLGSRPPVGLRPSISLHGFEGSTALGAPPVQQAGQVTGLTGSTTPTSQGHALAQDVGQSHHSLTVGLWDALEVPCGTFQSEGPLASGPVPSQSSVQGDGGLYRGSHGGPQQSNQTARVEERAAALAPTRGQQREEGAKGDGLKPQSGQEMRLNSGERGQADGSGSPMEERVEINNRIGGGAGRRLTLAELQAYFGYGLRDAAQRLNICPTTLKRACRRHGIQRWPRRQIVKETRRHAHAADSARSLEPTVMSGESLSSRCDRWGGGGGDSPSSWQEADDSEGCIRTPEQGGQVPPSSQGVPGGLALPRCNGLEDRLVAGGGKRGQAEANGPQPSHSQLSPATWSFPACSFPPTFSSMPQDGLQHLTSDFGMQPVMACTSALTLPLQSQAQESLLFMPTVPLPMSSSFPDLFPDGLAVPDMFN